ncbi:MAG: DUF2442 domain-containing protein [Hyphomicrobiales bacterium]|nr:DUF2442 domain-containing protein [Hyphomicrobiales bacterium]
MNKPPLIRSVKAKGPATLEIMWQSGEKLPVEVSRLIKRFKLYAPLRNTALFGRAKADPWGHAVNWPGDIDMGADQLYELAREQAAEWGPDRFAAWMEKHGLSLNAAADALGLSRRMIAHYRTGSRPIPRVVALACEGLSARWKKHAA